MPKPQAEQLPIFKSEKGEKGEALKQSFFLPPEPITKDANSYSLQQLQAMAFRHLSKSMLKDKIASRPNYLKCWATDMAKFIQDAGCTQQQFINSLN